MNMDELQAATPCDLVNFTPSEVCEFTYKSTWLHAGGSIFHRLIAQLPFISIAVVKHVGGSILHCLIAQNMKVGQIIIVLTFIRN